MSEELIELKSTDSVFTTGAFIRPIKVTINNIDQWRWIVTSFEGTSFMDGKEIAVHEYASELESIITATDIFKESL